MLIRMNIICTLLATVSIDFCDPSNVPLPEENMNTVELIVHNGYPAQEVVAQTADGYLLTLHRIPYGRRDPPSSRTGRPVVFLQHGLLASSADWVLNLPEQSLGFMLADAGFDVWMGNVRGNVYSRGHANSSIDQQHYWQFTWDEMAAFDLEAMVDKALQESAQESLYYVGYSQGTMIMFAHASEKPEFTKKIKKFFALAPVATVGHVKGTLDVIGRRFLPEIELFIRVTGEEEFLPSNFFTRMLSKLICGLFSFTNPLCANVLFQIVGPNTNQLNKTRLVVYLEHTPAGTSTNNIIHWAQMTVSGKTQKMDWRSEEDNMKHYGQPTPPVYNISRVNLPIYLYYSPVDWLADTEDVKTLLSTLPPSSIVQQKNLTDFNHIDFVYGLRAADEIYKDIITVVQKNENIA